MEKIKYLFLLILILSFGSCVSHYLPFKIKAFHATPCENTFNFNTHYKSKLSLNEMTEKLRKLNFEATCDTLFKGESAISPCLQISNYSINDTKIMWIHFTIFERYKHLSFYGFCLDKPLKGTKKEIKAQSKAIREKIEKDIAPLLVE
jgi:hypothetical protein